MSVAFAARGNRPPLSPAQIQKMLDENAHLIQTIQEYQAKGQIMECHQYQQILHRNLVYLASVADANQNIQSILPVTFFYYFIKTYMAWPTWCLADSFNITKASPFKPE